MVIPLSFSDRIVLPISLTMIGLSPWQGSSISSNFGLDISARATDSSSCSPPLMLWARTRERLFSAGIRGWSSRRYARAQRKDQQGSHCQQECGSSLHSLLLRNS